MQNRGSCNKPVTSLLQVAVTIRMRNVFTSLVPTCCYLVNRLFISATLSQVVLQLLDFVHEYQGSAFYSFILCRWVPAINHKIFETNAPFPQFQCCFVSYATRWKFFTLEVHGFCFEMAGVMPADVKYTVLTLKKKNPEDKSQNNRKTMNSTS